MAHPSGASKPRTAIGMLWIAEPFYVLAPPATPSASCVGGLQIAHSNRTERHPCSGVLGDACTFSCEEGYLAIGKHVCQTYEAGGRTFINRSFFGGRCERLCSSSPQCGADETAIRVNSTDSTGPCFSATCFQSQDAALRGIRLGSNPRPAFSRQIFRSRLWDTDRDRPGPWQCRGVAARTAQHVGAVSG